MPDAEYYRRWRKAHPEYRQRQTELRRKKRLVSGRGNRSREYAARRHKRLVDRQAPARLDTDPMLQRARAYVATKVTADTRWWVKGDLFDELVSEVLLATVTRTSRAKAVENWKKKHYQWSYRNLTGSGDGLPEIPE